MNNPLNDEDPTKENTIIKRKGNILTSYACVIDSINPLYQPQTSTYNFISETRKRFNRMNNPLNDENPTKENTTIKKEREIFLLLTPVS